MTGNANTINEKIKKEEDIESKPEVPTDGKANIQVLDLETVSDFDAKEGVDIRRSTYEEINTAELLIEKQNTLEKSIETDKMSIIKSQVKIEKGLETPKTENA